MFNSVGANDERGLMNDERQRENELLSAVHHSSFRVHRLPCSLDTQLDVRILLGSMKNIKQIFSLGNRPYEIVEVEGPIHRGNRTFPAQFDHELQGCCESAKQCRSSSARGWLRWR
jgi:hypothetical protein